MASKINFFDNDDKEKTIENIRKDYDKEMHTHLSNHTFVSPAELDSFHHKVSRAIIANHTGINVFQANFSETELEHELQTCYAKFSNLNKMSFNWDGKSDSQLAIGIDLGTCNTVVAVYYNNQVEIIPSSEGPNTTPSYIAFDVKGNITIGRAARNQMYKNAKNTFHDVKRLIGRKPVDIDVEHEKEYLQYEIVNHNNELKVLSHGILYSPEEISAKLLVHIKNIVEKKMRCVVDKAVITVPAYFNNNQRQATINAGEIAGFKVLNILSEPKAAAIAYKLKRYNDEAKRVLIFDLGGGTFDVAVLTTEGENIDVLTYGGDARLGGHDFDNRIFDHCIEVFQQTLFPQKTPQDIKNAAGDRSISNLKTECKRVKESLSFKTVEQIDVQIFAYGKDLELEITREKFEELIKTYLDTMIEIVDKTLNEKSVAKKSIDDIILVGGATRIPKLQERLTDYFLGRALNFSIRPDDAVAYGAAVEAALLNGQEEVKKKLNIGQDVTSISYGIEIVLNGLQGCFNKIIPKNTKFPAEKEEIFCTTFDYQTKVAIRIFQGEAALASDNYNLGEFELAGIPPAPKGQQMLTVIMRINSMGVLFVKATCQSTKTSKEVILDVCKIK